VNISSGDEIETLAKDFNVMAEELESSISELTDSMHRQEEFMGSFAHELKTPMTSIIGYSDLLRSRELSDDERLEAANYIFSESKRLESLSLKLQDLLLLKHDSIEFSAVSPEAVITGVVKTMKPVLSKSGITIKSRCESGSCLMDADLVKSLLINLIDNARKAIDGEGTVFILSEMTETGCKIQIADTGRGMQEDELNRITEAFYRVDKSRSRAQGGAGLGLALCKQIVELHRGTMSFRSIPGKGTNITVELNGGAA
jgi:signal transduction histidine kinase